MKKYFITFKRAIKKNRFQFICFTVIIFISSLFLNLGLTVALNFNKSLDDKFTAAKAVDVFYLINNKHYNDGLLTDLKNIPDVKSTEVRDCYQVLGSFTVGTGKDIGCSTVILNRDDGHRYNDITVEESGKDSEDSAYVSYWLKSYYGAKLGDTLEYKCGDDEFDFTISGFVEDVECGSNGCECVAIHLSNAAFNKLSQNSAAEKYASKSVYLISGNTTLSEKIFNDGYKILCDKLGAPTIKGDYYTNIIKYRTQLVDILAYMVCLFALAITLISLFVCGFRIRNGIDEDMQNIGTMKALGFSSRQIIGTVAFPYIFICVIAATIGVACSFAAIPLFNNLIEIVTGLIYRSFIDPVSVIITMLILLFTVVVTILISTCKIKKISPVAALESGIEHHNFKRNFLPVANSHLPINITLGFKNFFSMLKQNFSLFTIMTLLTFLVLFGVSALYNINLHPKNFVNTINEETCNIRAVTNGKAEELASQLKGINGIRKTLYYERVNIQFNDLTVYGWIDGDFSKLDVDPITKGRGAEHDNEVVLGCSYDKEYKLGDTVSLGYGDARADYLVVGFFQSPNSFGKAVSLTVDGFKRINKDYEPSTLYIYLDKNLGSDDCIKMLETEHSDIVTNTYNNDTLLQSTLGNYLRMTAILATVNFFVVIIITFLILLIIFSTFIIQRRTDFGVLKAVGYTSTQIILQCVLGLMPAIILGITAGSLLASFLMDNFWIMILSSIVLRKTSLVLPVTVTFAAGFIILAVSIIISVLILSKSIRKISATRLIQD